MNEHPSIETEHRGDDTFGVGLLRVEHGVIRSLRKAASSMLRTTCAGRVADGRTLQGAIE